MTPNLKILLATAIGIAAVVGGWFAWNTYQKGQEAPPAASTDEQGNGLITLALGETGSVGAVTLMPREIVEDSRCPTDVQCIQAGRLRLRATLSSGLGTANQVFLVGEPVTTEAEAVTLVSVAPVKVSTVSLKSSDYRFTFKVEPRAFTYRNASANLIRVDTPQPGAVTGKEFRISGQARGNWFFEASFPIEVFGDDGKRLAVVVAQAGSDWMTTDFVPFAADVSVPESYIGRATIVLHKDNPSGLPANDASVSFPITIEY